MSDFRDPYEAAHWDLVPGRTALVHIDLQNDFLHADGWYAASGIDIAHMQRVIEPAKRLTGAARERGVPVVWTRHGTRGVEEAGRSCSSPVPARRRPARRTWGYEILDELEPRDDDWFVEKNRLSAFFNTNLELVLRAVPRGHGPRHRRADEPVRGGDLEGRDVPRLQADRRRRARPGRRSRICTSPPWR